MTLTNFCTYLSLEEINDGLRLCAKLLTKVQPSMVLSPDPVDEELEDQDHDDWEIVEGPAPQVGKGKRSDSSSSSSHTKNSSQRSLDTTLSVGSDKEDVSSRGDAGENHNQNHELSDKDEQIEFKGVKAVTVPVSPERSLDRLVSDPNAEIVTRVDDDEDDEEDVTVSKSKRPTHVDSLSLHSDGGSESRHIIDSKLRTSSITSLTASLTESELETTPVFLMQACVQCFQSFFFKFISSKILPNSDAIKLYVAKLQVGKRAGMENRQPAGDGNGDDMLLKLPKGLEELMERDQPENGRIRTDSMLTSDSSTANYLGK